ncbi:MAG: 2Fe-2S iron-sulfur cluster-binding protein, partial [Candidatus Zixiibacteriota bacterium]
GKQVFQLILGEKTAAGPAAPVADAAPSKEPAPAPAASVAATPGGMEITFAESGKSVPFTPGKTICEIAEENGVKIVAECHAGICGSDPVKIISGQEYLNERTDGEKDASEDICDMDPNECRLACMLRPTGPVNVEILES